MIPVPGLLVLGAGMLWASRWMLRRALDRRRRGEPLTATLFGDWLVPAVLLAIGGVSAIVGAFVGFE